MPSPSLQHFELHVLLAMLRERGETYRVPLVLALEERTRRPVSQAAVFIALRRLERKGLVTSRIDKPSTGRTRRYFSVTEDGVATVEAHRAEHARLWQGLDRILRAHKA
jgi:PadR family transcriptional regulator, regulatory protein PadR